MSPSETDFTVGDLGGKPLVEYFLELTQDAADVHYLWLGANCVVFQSDPQGCAFLPRLYFDVNCPLHQRLSRLRKPRLLSTSLSVRLSHRTSR